MRDQRWPWVYDAIVSVQILMGFFLVLFYARLVGSGHFATTARAIGAFATMMLTLFVMVAPALHEMFHRENTFLRWMGRLGMVIIFDPWREITHVVTHHVHTVTPNDPDYARRGENLYRHLFRTFRGQIVGSFHLERRMWTKRERAWWDPRNAWVWRAGILVAFVVLLLAIGGWTGAVAGVAVCLLGPRMFLEIFNYTQHYGLVTGTPGRFERRHTSNHLTPFVRLLALEITNHAGHHEDSYKHFYQLEPDRTGPKQPQFLLCILLAFVPPLWFAMVRPRLKHWDRHYANRQERELAEVENIRAGWADLNEDAPAAEREVEQIMTDCAPRLVIVTAEFIDRAPEDALVAGSEGRGRATLASLEAGSSTDWPAIDPDAPFLQLYTSGTTGLPKGVPQTHRNHLAAQSDRQAPATTADRTGHAGMAGGRGSCVTSRSIGEAASATSRR